MRLWWLGALAGCGGTDEALLESLAGAWSGAATVDAQTLGMTGEFRYESALQGSLIVEETAMTVTYGIRRADAFNDVIELDLQQEGGEQFLTLSRAGLDDGALSGDATMTYDCGEAQPCGYSGTFSLTAAGSDTGSP